MIPNPVIEEVLEHADIVQVIGEFVDLKKKGQNYQGRSPFTQDKNPSFVVSPAKGIFKCFSSRKSGGVVRFLKEHKGMSFPQAICYLAAKYGIDIPEEDSLSEEETEKARIKETLFSLNEFAASFFRQALPLSKVAADYASLRISGDNQAEFSIGYAPGDWHSFEQAATGAGYSLSTLLLGGLVSQNEKGQSFDFFRNRLIFPIHNHVGRICAFAGRSLDGSPPKYLNTTNTPTFNKSATLYGLFFAQDSIRRLDLSVLVEGYTDVTSLHAAGVYNCVAPCGTALTPEQCKLLARYSRNVVLMYDGDEPGQKAAVRNARIALEAGMLPFVIQLPKEEDPDSFVRNHPGEDIPGLIISRKQAFPLWYADLLLPDTFEDQVLRNESIKNICNVLVLYEEDSLVQLFIDSISKKYKIRAAFFLDRIRQISPKAEPVTIEGEVKLPAGVDPTEFQKWGFYEDKNQYFIGTKEGVLRISNFVMKPLFHVESTVEAKRIFELTNFAGHKVTVNFDMTEITSILNFRRVIEGKGNFLFWGQDAHLTKVKMKLYEHTRTCGEIRNLGWQKEGFWAWANGISTENGFTETDITGLVEFNDRFYFIPAFSNIYIEDKTVFLDERKFIFLERDISIRKWACQFIDVFGTNARFGIAFYISALFRDHILNLFSNFPLLNLFGPKGTGKSQMAMSLSCLFGRQQTPFNIHNGTKAGLAEHIQQFVNSLSWIDEYKNNIEYDKVETLKSIYDSIGRNRLNYDKGKKKETTLVNSAVVLSGQEMPTADVALFSRVIFLMFQKTEYSADEKANYDILKGIEKQGLSHITAEILKHRAYFVEHYFHNYDYVLRDLGADLKDNPVEDRILRSWCLILASVRLLAERLDLPFTYEDIKKDARDSILIQTSQITTSNEMATFWDVIEAMYDGNVIISKWHFMLPLTDKIRSKKEDVMLARPMKVLKIKFNSIYTLYSEHIRRMGGKALPASTLKYYLEHQKYFLGVETSTRFYRKDYIAAEGKPVEQKQVTSSYCFEYEPLGINLERDLEPEAGISGAVTGYSLTDDDNPFD